MTLSADQHALRHAMETCKAHATALGEALEDLARRRITAPDLDRLSREDRRLLDQFAYRYTRLQDDMGARLFPAALRTLGEEIAAMPMIDRLNRLEQLGWLPSADEWMGLRDIRNEFTHDYPEKAEERLARLSLAIDAAKRLLEILVPLEQKVQERAPDSSN